MARDGVLPDNSIRCSRWGKYRFSTNSASVSVPSNCVALTAVHLPHDIVRKRSDVCFNSVGVVDRRQDLSDADAFGTAMFNSILVISNQP